MMKRKSNYYNRCRMLLIGILTFMQCILFMEGQSMAKEEQEKLIFSFDKTSEAQKWRAINDPVMGGLSESSLQATNQETALFSGNVSLKNFGGFASINTIPADYNLNGYEGISIRVKGDGKKYKFSLKTDTAFTGFSYLCPFSTEKNAWTVIRLPFKDFIPSFRGRVVTDAGKLDSGKIKSFGLLISDKQEGPFRLEIDWIKAYKK